MSVSGNDMTTSVMTAVTTMSLTVSMLEYCARRIYSASRLRYSVRCEWRFLI